MTNNPAILTVHPGSALDKAIDAVVDYELGAGPQPDKAIVGIIDPTNSGHMVALGCRMDCRRRGKTDPTQLTHQEWHGWYGEML